MTNNQQTPKTVKEAWSLFKKDWENPTKRKIKQQKVLIFLGSLLRAFLLIGLCFVIIMPFFQKLSFAFRSPFDINNPQVVWIPETWSTLNIEIAIATLGLPKTFFNSIYVAAIATFIQVIATAVAGYSFARLKFKGNNILFYLVLFSLVVPNESTKMARGLFYTNYSFFGINLIANGFAIFIMSIFGMGLRSAIFIFLFRQFFRNIPVELEESAQVDGAGVIRTFWSVMLPNARGSIVTVSLFAFVWQYNDYFFANLFNLEGTKGWSLTTIPINLANVSSSTIKFILRTRTDWLDIFGADANIDQQFVGLIANTCALLMMLPLLIAYFFVQKLFVESIERTGITGI